MTLEIHLSPEAEKCLRERAAKSGVDVSTYAARILEDDLSRPSLDEILGPVRVDIARSGMSEEKIIDLGRREIEALREEKARRGNH